MLVTSTQSRLRRKSIMSSKTIYKTCPICKTEFNAYSKWTKDKTYCSKSCANSSRGARSEETKSKISQKLLGEKPSTAQIEKFKETMRLRRVNKLENHNSKYTPNCKICDKPKPLIYKVTCSKQCYKKLATENALKQVKHGGGHKGIYKGYRSDSTYELAFIIWHLDNSIAIERSKNVYDYTYKGKISKYNPDFIIDGIEYEIKGYMCNRARAKLDQNPHIRVIDRNGIQKYIKYVQSKYRVKNLQELYE